MIIALLVSAAACFTAAASRTGSPPPARSCHLTAKLCSLAAFAQAQQLRARKDGLVTVGSGRWGKTSWRFQVGEPTSPAYDSGGHGILCTRLVLNNDEAMAGVLCGTFQFFRPFSAALRTKILHNTSPNRSRLLTLLTDPPKIQVGSEGDARRVAVFGEVVSSARELKITFTNNTSVRVAVLPPTGKLLRSVAFYAAPMPCNTTVKTIIALGSNNQVVAKYPWPVMGPLQPHIDAQC